MKIFCKLTLNRKRKKLMKDGEKATEKEELNLLDCIRTKTRQTTRKYSQQRYYSHCQQETYEKH